MNDNLYSKINKCKAINEKYNIEELNKIITAYEAQGKSVVPSITFIQHNSSSAVVIDTMKTIGVASEALETLQDKNSFLVELVYGNDACVFNEGDFYTIAVNNENLKDKKYNFLYNKADEYIAKVTALSSEKLYFYVDALVAFNLNQKNWLNENATDYYSKDRLNFCLYNLDFLFRSDKEKVLEYSKSIAQEYSNQDFIKSINELVDDCNNTNLISLQEAARKQIESNYVKEVECLVEKIKAEGEEVIAKSNELIEKISCKKSALGVCSQVVVDQVKLMLDEVLLEIKSSASTYSINMKGNINEAINLAKDPLEAEKRIEDYLESAWDHFIEAIAKKITSAINKINAVISKQIEKDIKLIFVEFDEAELHMMEKIYLSNKADISGSDYYVEADGSSIDSVSKLTKDLLLISGSTLLIDPMVNVVTTAGSKFLSKISGKKYTEEFKSEVRINATNACNEYHNFVVNDYANVIEATMSKQEEAIKKEYNSFIDMLSENIKTELDNEAKINDSIDEILNTLN